MAIKVSSVGFKTEPKPFTYDWKDLVLYALGVGATVEELDYLYEGRGPKALPTFAVVPVIGHVFSCLKYAEISLASVVHGAQSVRVLGELPPSGVLATHAEVAAIYDLKKFATLVVKTVSVLEGGGPIFETEWSIVARGAGGFGGTPPPRSDEGSIPDREADFRHEQATLREQALIYRLSGDTNPLHADPQVANQAGFDRGPILHGLATLGYAARALILGACGGDGGKLSRIDGQFRKPVWPGETLVTEGWLDGRKVVYRVKAKERDEVVLGNAWAQIG